LSEKSKRKSARWRKSSENSVDSSAWCKSQHRLDQGAKYDVKMEICLAESGTYASGSILLRRWATVKAQPKKAVS
jgi:hypothetical protein